MKEQNEVNNFLTVLLFVTIVILAVGLSFAYLLPLLSTFSGIKTVFFTYVSIEIIKDTVKYIVKGVNEINK